MIIKDYLEISYFIASIFMTFIAIIGLKEIDLIRKVASDQAKRDAVKLSAEIYKYYVDTTTPLKNTLAKSLRDKEIKLDDFFVIGGTREEPTISKKTGTTEEFISKFIKSKCLHDFIAWKNSIGVFASYFTSGIADEKTAYNMIGKEYLKTMEKYMPLLLVLEVDNEKYPDETFEEGDYHSAALKLYHTWSSRKEHYGLLRERNRIMESLAEKKVDDTPPIGVNR